MMIHLTDSAGQTFVPTNLVAEPNIDSVVLSDGPHGMAWQRYSDGLWYPLRSRKGRTWDEVLRCRNLVLVYDAPPRPSPVRHNPADGDLDLPCPDCGFRFESEERLAYHRQVTHGMVSR